MRQSGAAIAALPQSERLAAFHEAAYNQYQTQAPPWLRYDVLLAQAILETGTFSSRLFTSANNAFGMLFNSRNYAIGTFPIGNYNYARYSAVSQSVADYIARMVAANSGRFTGGRQPFDEAETLTQYLRVLNDPKRPAGNYAEASGYNASIERIVEQTVGPFLRAKGIPPSRLQTVSGTPLGGFTEELQAVLDSIDSSPRNPFWWVIPLVGLVLLGGTGYLAYRYFRKKKQKKTPTNPRKPSEDGNRNKRPKGKASSSRSTGRKRRKTATK